MNETDKELLRIKAALAHGQDLTNAEGRVLLTELTRARWQILQMVQEFVRVSTPLDLTRIFPDKEDRER